MNILSPTIDVDESLTKAQAAEFMKVSTKQIERYMATGRLKYYQGPRFTRRDLIQFRELLAVDRNRAQLRRVV